VGRLHRGQVDVYGESPFTLYINASVSHFGCCRLRHKSQLGATPGTLNVILPGVATATSRSTWMMNRAPTTTTTITGRSRRRRRM